MQRKISLIALLIVIAALLISCSDGLVNFKIKGDHYEDDKGNIWYAAPLSFEPVSTGAALAKLGDSLLCEIPEMDSSQWLAEAYEGIGAVYYSEETVLPTLTDFGATSFVVCRVDAITVSVAQSDDAELTGEIVALINEGAAAELATSGNSYHIKFISESYPGLYYDLLYIEGDDGKYYFYNRAEGKSVECGRILAEYMPTESELLSGEEESEG